MPASDPVIFAQQILAWAEEDPVARSRMAQAQISALAAGLDEVPPQVLEAGHVLASMADATRFLTAP